MVNTQAFWPPSSMGNAMTKYDDQNIFAKIIRGEIPCYKVYEDDTFMAFLDINPRASGHVQVIPKEHTRWVWDVPNAGAYFEVVRKIAKAQQRAFNTELVRSQIFGDEVPHAHIWIWPNEESGSKKDFEGNAEKIKKFLLTIKYLKGYSIELIVIIKREIIIFNIISLIPLKR